MRRKKEASKVIQTMRQSNTTHPRQSLLPRKTRVRLEPTTLYTCTSTLLSLFSRMPW